MSGLVIDHADLPERTHLEGSDRPLAIEVQLDNSPVERARLIDHDAAVRDKRRRRGWPTREATLHDIPGVDTLLVGIVPDADQNEAA